MFFTSNSFIFLFLPISLIGYYGIGRLHTRASAAWLGVVSIVYYGWFNPIYVPLLFGSLTFNYATSAVMDRFVTKPATQTAVLAVGILANLFLLFFYKYLFPILGFFHSSGLIAVDFGTIALPIGISFFTFTQIAFLVDHKQGLATERNIINYIVFVTFFPHMVAGPILHHKEMMPQFASRETYKFQVRNLLIGLAIFGIGLLKKLVLADQAKDFADTAFAYPEQLGMIGAWTGVLFYTLQLYFDFSGYSDMAIGLARMFGVKFPVNFNSPFKAKNMIEFWQRWHMTLTRYLTVYVFNPLALWIARRRLANNKPANRKATETVGGFLSMILFPTFVTMLASGIWHGAGLRYVVWGGTYAIYLVINHLWRIFKRRRNHGRKDDNGVLNVSLTFFAVISAMVLFRAESLPDAVVIYKAMFGLNGMLDNGGAGSSSPASILPSLGTAVIPSIFEIVLLVGCYAIIWGAPNTQEILARYEPILESKGLRKVKWAYWLTAPGTINNACRVMLSGICAGIIAMTLLSAASGNKPFVYAFF